MSAKKYVVKAHDPDTGEGWRSQPMENRDAAARWQEMLAHHFPGQKFQVIEVYENGNDSASSKTTTRHRPIS